MRSQAERFGTSALWPVCQSSLQLLTRRRKCLTIRVGRPFRVPFEMSCLVLSSSTVDDPIDALAATYSPLDALALKPRGRPCGDAGILTSQLPACHTGVTGEACPINAWSLEKRAPRLRKSYE